MSAQVSYSAILKAARDWARTAAEQGWLRQADIQALLELDDRQPAALFQAGSHRPLVAAFFGGTGVGKSSLLNRLADQVIARVGVERPTSREVSLYLHESVQLASLPGDLPLEQVRIGVHGDANRKQVLWVDMPDIDSVEQLNRELVLRWLPHLDVLVYVVSPERYRDDKAWRLLQSHGGEHAWIFVLNQWDRADPRQLDDFTRLLLRDSGFADPLVLRTDCRPEGARSADDFARLQEVLTALADDHLMRQLELRTETFRREQLANALEKCRSALGDARGYRELAERWEQIWQRAEKDLLAGLEWPIANLAQAAVGRDTNPLLKRLKVAEEAKSGESLPSSEAQIWDDWADGRLHDALDQLIVDTTSRNLPAAPLKSALQPVASESGRAVRSEAQLGLRRALARPGNLWQRAGLKIGGALIYLMPLAAVTWVAYVVVEGFYRGEQGQRPYLGGEFAIHSALLVAVAWALPFILVRSLKPSAEKAAVHGLKRGVSTALAETDARVSASLEKLDAGREEQAALAAKLISQARNVEKPTADASGLLRQVLRTGTGG